MILCDSEIRAMLRHGQLKIDPIPSTDTFTTTTVDLRLGGTDFKRWTAPSGPGVKVEIDPSEKGWFLNAARFLSNVPQDSGGSVLLDPSDFLLAITLVCVDLPEESRIAV